MKMMFKNKIYNIFLKCKGINYNNQYFEIKTIQHRNDLIEFRQLNQKKLLLHAYNHVPYYHRLLKNTGVVNGENIDLSKFDKIPILTKEIMRSEELLSDDYMTRNWYENFSGGSTGEPTRFIQDANYTRWFNASSKFYYIDILSIDEINVKKIELWGSPRDLYKGSIGIKAKIGTWLTNTVLLNSFRMTEEDMQRYVNTINSYRPDLIRGYAGSLFELCRFIEKKKLSIYTPKILVSSAETLTNEMRETIESIFGTKLYDFYGSRETASIAGECRCGLMHIFEFNNYIEVLDENDQPVKEGKEGRVIVTNLHNYSMPFIRYEIGDMAKLGPNNCKCGNILPTLEKIYGRIEEQFIRKDGGIVIGYYFVHLMGVVLNKGFIKKFQVIQEDYDKIRLLVIPNIMLPDMEKKDIEKKIRLQMGQDCKIIWDFVDEIPKTKSGKYLYTKTLIAK
ncbi:MAG: phenylacetate--CoA ligase family protein [Actinobacteria bacterium]|nr:phenylacetate--CoA ligase family protein [Actinomycetota bacterium]